MLISMFGHLIAMAAAILAVLGDTWDGRRSGIRKLRPTGWAVFVVAAAGFLVSSFGTYQRHLDQLERERLAMEEVEQAWRKMISPFRIMLWHIDGRQSDPDAEMVRRLLDDQTYSRIENIDLRGDAPHHHGSWGEVICRSTKSGYDDLRHLQSIYVGVVDTDIIKVMKDVAASYAVHPMMATYPCGSGDFGDEYPWYIESVTNENMFRIYLNALLSMRVKIDEYKG